MTADDRPSGALPPPPDPRVDRYLDALVRVVLRHGFSRATVPDVAADLGVSRVTVYRQVGTVDQMARLLLHRELHRLMASVTAVLEEADGSDALVELVTEIITFLQRHPVVRKVLTDEPAVIGPFLVRHLPVLLRQASVIAVPFLDALMDDGRLARREASHLADWLGRLVVTAVLAPPPGSLTDYLESGLRPLLEPLHATGAGSSVRRARRRRSS